MERWFLAALSGLLISGAGCGKSDATPVAEGHRGEHGLDVDKLGSGYVKQQPEVVLPAKNESPDKVVEQFLAAATAGDQRKLAALMTKAAREETQKYNINFELESYQNATFKIGEYEFLTPEKNTAHVSCKWTDHDGQESFTHDVIWVLRKEEPGWRVVGMITRPFEDHEPVAFNYENVKELMDTKANIEAEVKRRSEEQERQSRRAARAEKEKAATQK